MVYLFVYLIQGEDDKFDHHHMKDEHNDASKKMTSWYKKIPYHNKHSQIHLINLFFVINEYYELNYLVVNEYLKYNHLRRQYWKDKHIILQHQQDQYQ